MVGSKNGPWHRGEEGFYYNNKWYKPLPLIPENQRTFPLPLIPDHILFAEHVRSCRCPHCGAWDPQELWERKKWWIRYGTSRRRSPYPLERRPPDA